MDRLRTDVRMPRDLALQVEDACAILGLRKNTFLTMAVALLLAQLAEALPVGKRETVVRVAEEHFAVVWDRVRKAL